MTIGVESPTPIEVRDQLARMLAGKRFKTAWSQAGFLELVVHRALEGKKTPGHIVAKTLFKGKFRKDESTDVRTTAINLRSSLKKYYGGEGRADLVRIALPDPPEDKSVKLPEGEAYTPTFAYNPVHAVGREYQLGMYYLTRGMLMDSLKATEHFATALKMAPEHLGAAIGMCEVHCSDLYWDRGFTTEEQEDKWLLEAAQFLDRVHERARRFWRLWAAAGYLLVTGAVRQWEKDNLEKAQTVFEKALTLDRANTEAYPPYFEFLIKVGKKNEAMRLAMQYLDARPSDMAAHTACARTLLSAHELSTAKEVLQKALAIDRGYYGVHFFLGLINLVERRPEDIKERLLQVRLLADELTFFKAVESYSKVTEQWPPELYQKWRKALDEVKAISPWPEPSSG